MRGPGPSGRRSPGCMAWRRRVAGLIPSGWRCLTGGPGGWEKRWGAPGDAGTSSCGPPPESAPSPPSAPSLQGRRRRIAAIPCRRPAGADHQVAARGQRGRGGDSARRARGAPQARAPSIPDPASPSAFQPHSPQGSLLRDRGPPSRRRRADRHQPVSRSVTGLAADVATKAAIAVNRALAKSGNHAPADGAPTGSGTGQPHAGRASSFPRPPWRSPRSFTPLDAPLDAPDSRLTLPRHRPPGTCLAREPPLGVTPAEWPGLSLSGSIRSRLAVSSQRPRSPRNRDDHRRRCDDQAGEARIVV